MATRADLVDWVYLAVKANGGKAKIVDVAKHIWTHHHADLASSGNLFYSWQYDMRWAALQLRKKGMLAAVGSAPRGVWALRKWDQTP